MRERDKGRETQAEDRDRRMEKEEKARGEKERGIEDERHRDRWRGMVGDWQRSGERWGQSGG